MITDVVLTCYLTCLFAWPLFRGVWKNAALRALAVRSILAALLTLASSVSNLSVLNFHHGSELGWVCLATCTLDTAWCAFVLVLLTSKRERGEMRPTASTVDRVTTQAATTVAGPEVRVGTRLKDAAHKLGRTISRSASRTDQDGSGCGGVCVNVIVDEWESGSTPSLDGEEGSVELARGTEGLPPAAPTPTEFTEGGKEATKTRTVKWMDTLGLSRWRRSEKAQAKDDPALWRGDHPRLMFSPPEEGDEERGTVEKLKEWEA